jgi:5-methylcytosine-specific restriction endonuclease McrA
MAHTICYEVFPTAKNIKKMRAVLVERHGFTEKENQYGSYFVIEVPAMDSWQIKTVLKTRRYKYRCFDQRYERSNKYRKTFFDENDGPHRCAYCGRRLRRADDIEVDHLIPVSRAKSSFTVRTWLQICGILDVNDPKNLVASCRKCNRKKSDKMGLWVVRGAIGRFKLIWTIRDIIVILLVALVIAIICQHFPVVDFVHNIVIQMVK